MNALQNNEALSIARNNQYWTMRQPASNRLSAIQTSHAIRHSTAMRFHRYLDAFCLQNLTDIHKGFKIFRCPLPSIHIIESADYRIPYRAARLPYSADART